MIPAKTVSAESAEDDKSATVQDFSSFPSAAQQSWGFAGSHSNVSAQPAVVDDASGGFSFPQQYEGGSASVSGAGGQSSFFANASQGSDNSSVSNNQFFSGDQWYNLPCG
jgi:hypothetical protein